MAWTDLNGFSLPLPERNDPPQAKVRADVIQEVQVH